MKKLFSLTLLVFFVFVFSASLMAAGKKSEKKITIKGEVLDMACYISHGGMGADHAACAKKCVKGGQPMGLITADGKVFLLFSGHDDSSAFEKTKDYAGKQVQITGQEFERSGFKGITVREVKPL